jgi:hypothetical protein
MWRQSPPHRANLLNPRRRQIGLARIAPSADCGPPRAGYRMGTNYGNNAYRWLQSYSSAPR